MFTSIISVIALSILTAVLFSALFIAAIMALVAFGEYVYNKMSGWFKLLKIWYRERNGKIRSAVIVIQGRDENKLRFRLENDSKVYSPEEVPEFKYLLDMAENKNSYIELEGQRLPAVHLDKKTEELAFNQNNNNN